MTVAAVDAFENDVPPLFSPGDTVGPYVIERRLGAGGFGEVFLARERSPKRLVALKFVRPELAANPIFVQRFEREVDAMAAVEHPNVVPIYVHGQEQGRRFFAMRYVSGGSLDALLTEHAPALEDVVRLLAGVAEGLDCCHARGVVHRDLKPANVLVDAERHRGLLTDFGIALTEDISTMTSPGHRPGTPAYMAPETLTGGRATGASDLWALGAIAYRAATGALPRGLHQPADSVPVPPSARNHRFGPDVDRVILRALSPDPARRYGSATAFVSDLLEALDRSTHRTRSTIPPPLPRKLGPRRLWSVAGAAVVLLPGAAYGVKSITDRGPACHASYADACLNPDVPDYDCKSGDGDGPGFVTRTVRVVGPDEFRLDGDGDGLAC